MAQAIGATFPAMKITGAVRPGDSGGGVLDEFRPAVTSELDDRLLGSLGYNSAKVVDLFARHKYRVFDESTGEELVAGAARGPFIGEIVALPQEACA